MRNSEVVHLVESVNNVLHNNKISDNEVEQIKRWAQMGVDETGSTGYRVIVILAAQLADSRDGLLKLIEVSSEESIQAAVEAKEADLAAQETPEGLNVGQPVRTIAELDDDGLDDEPLEEEEEDASSFSGELAGYR